LAANAHDFTEELRESFGLLGVAVRNTALENCLSFLPVILHLAFELLPGIVVESELLQKPISREVLEMLSDTPYRLNEFLLIVLIIDFKRS
jgi:hypothetical protein